MSTSTSSGAGHVSRRRHVGTTEHEKSSSRAGGGERGSRGSRSARRSRGEHGGSSERTSKGAGSAHLALLIQSVRVVSGRAARDAVRSIARIVRKEHALIMPSLGMGILPAMEVAMGKGVETAGFACEVLAHIAHESPAANAAVLSGGAIGFLTPLLTVKKVIVDGAKMQSAAELGTAAAACRALRAIASRPEGAVAVGMVALPGLASLVYGRDADSRVEAAAALAAIVGQARKVSGKRPVAIAHQCIPLFASLLKRGAGSRPRTARASVAEFAAWGLLASARLPPVRPLLMERALEALAHAVEETPPASACRRASLNTIVLLASDTHNHTAIARLPNFLPAVAEASLRGDPKESAASMAIFRSVTVAEETRAAVWDAGNAAIFDVVSGRQGLAAQVHGIVTLASFAGYPEWKKAIVEGAGRTLGDLLLAGEDEVAEHAARALRNASLEPSVRRRLADLGAINAIGSYLTLAPAFISRGRLNALLTVRNMGSAPELLVNVRQRCLAGVVKALVTSEQVEEADLALRILRGFTVDRTSHEELARVATGSVANYLSHPTAPTPQGRYSALVVLSATATFPIGGEQILELAMPAIRKIMENPRAHASSRAKPTRLLFYSLQVLLYLSTTPERCADLARSNATSVSAAAAYAIEHEDRRVFGALSKLVTRWCSTYTPAVLILRDAGVHSQLRRAKPLAASAVEVAALSHVLEVVATPAAAAAAADREPQSPWEVEEEEDDEGEDDIEGSGGGGEGGAVDARRDSVPISPDLIDGEAEWRENAQRDVGELMEDTVIPADISESHATDSDGDEDDEEETDEDDGEGDEDGDTIASLVPAGKLTAKVVIPPLGLPTLEGKKSESGASPRRKVSPRKVSPRKVSPRKVSPRISPRDKRASPRDASSRHVSPRDHTKRVSPRRKE